MMVTQKKYDRRIHPLEVLKKHNLIEQSQDSTSKISKLIQKLDKSLGRLNQSQNNIQHLIDMLFAGRDDILSDPEFIKTDKPKLVDAIQNFKTVYPSLFINRGSAGQALLKKAIEFTIGMTPEDRPLYQLFLTDKYYSSIMDIYQKIAKKYN